MSKLKGQRFHEQFYYRVQRDLLEKLIGKTITRLVLTDFNENLYFVSPDHQVFYLIPKDAWYLDNSYYRPCNALFEGGAHYVSDLFWVDPTPLEKTGFYRELSVGFDPFNPQLIVDLVQTLPDGAKHFYIKQDHLKLFPKDHSYLKSSSPNGPIFVASSLKTLLGGCFTLSLPTT